MTLKDILLLKKEEASLNIIKEYLNQPRALTDYQVAFIWLLEIELSLELFENALVDGEYLLATMDKKRDSINYETVLRILLDVSLSLDNLDKAAEYAERRKEALPVIRQYLAILDTIKLKKKKGLNYEEEIKMALSDVLPDKLKLALLTDYFAILKNKNDLDRALEIADQILVIDENNDIFSDKLRLLLATNRFDEAKEIALAAYDKVTKKAIAFCALIKVYLEEGNYHKAIILDAENEEFIETLNDEDKKEIYGLMVKLYEKVDNKLSLDNYKRKLNKILKKDTKVASSPPASTEKLAAPANQVEHKKVPNALIPPKKPAIIMPDTLEKASELLVYSHQLSFNLPWREFLRMFFISLEKQLPFKECYLYLRNENINFFHYKMERLYDKRIATLLITNTVVDHVLETLSEVVEETKNVRFTKNIITQVDYEQEVTALIALPIADLGVFVIHFNPEIKEYHKYYDLVKLVAAILYTRLIDEKQIQNYKAERVFLNDIWMKNFVPVRIQSEHFSTYNDLAKKLFDCDTHFDINEFYNYLDYHNIHEYKAIIKRLLVTTNEVLSITYQYKNIIIKERLISLKEKEENKIVSIFEDITDNINIKKELKNRSVVDYETSLANVFALEEKISDYFSKKVSFVMVRMNKDLDLIYGSEQAKLFFREFAQITKKYFADSDTYRFNENTLLIVIPSNDIRTVTKNLKEYLTYLKNTSSQVIKYEHFEASLGVVRYPVVTMERTKEKIYRFLSIALNKAMLSADERIAFFSYSDYEEDIFEMQVIEHINNAIKEHNLELHFNQITDIVNKKIWQYESSLNVPNLRIDNKYLLTIAKKRNLLAELERHHIRLAVDFLTALAKATNRLIRITIPLAKETFIAPTFNSFLIGLLKERNLDFGFIRLKIDGYIKSAFVKNIHELREYGITVDTNDLEMALSKQFDGFHYDLKNSDEFHLEFLMMLVKILDKRKMALIIRNVNNKEMRDELTKAEIRYLTGDIYKRVTAADLLKKIEETYERN